MASSWQSSCFMDQERFGKTGSSVIALWYSDVHSQNLILSAFRLLPRCFWILKAALGKDLESSWIFDIFGCSWTTRSMRTWTAQFLLTLFFNFTWSQMDAVSVFRHTLASPLLEVEDTGSVDGYCLSNLRIRRLASSILRIIKNQTIYWIICMFTKSMPLQPFGWSRNRRRCKGSRRPPSAESCWQFQ